MHFVLDKIVNQWYQGTKEGPRQVFSVLDCPGIIWTQDDTTISPWYSRDEIRNHEDVVPLVIISRRNICPSTTCQCSKHAHERNEFWEALIPFRRKEIPQRY